MNDNQSNSEPSKVKGLPPGADIKTLPLNVLKQKVIDKIYSYKQLTDEYKQQVVDLFKPLKFDRQTYINMLKDKNFLQDDTRLYYVKPNGSSKKIGDPSPRAVDEVAKGFDPDNTKPFYFGRVFKVLPGPFEGTVPGYWSTTGTYNENPHWATSLLKWYLSCLIEHFDLTANSITGKKWLNHSGKGPNVITGAFDTHCLQSKMEVIMKTGIPVIMVFEYHHKGFHFGTMRSYYCDSKDRVKGVSHGSDHFWYDVNNTFGYAGMIGTYKYTTIATFGNQRIIWFRPGTSFANEPYVPRKEKTWLPLDDSYLNPDPPSPSYDLGLYDMVEDDQPTEVIMRPKKRLVENIVDVPLPVRFVRYITKPTNWLKNLTSAAVLGSVMYAGVVTKHKGAAVAVCTGLASAKAVCHYYKMLTSTPTIKLAIIPLRFKGKYAKALKEFYLDNSIDGDTGLPYGFYYLEEGVQLIQVQQVGDGANYTNAYKLIQRFCAANGMSHNNAPGIYEGSIPHSGPNITKPNDAVFHDPLESPIKRITSACRYRVEVKETTQTGVRLLSQEQYRQFIASKITKKVVAASASNRVCCGGKVSQLTREEHHQMYRNFWFKYTKNMYRNHKPVLSLIPDLTQYKGSKYRKYVAAFLTLGSKYPFVKYTTFMKMEALNLDSFIRKAVRLISPNTPLFNVAYKNFFHWFEKTLLSFTSVYGHNLFAKGQTVHNRWLTILMLVSKFKICVPIDFKNFDATHRNQAFAGECDTYNDLGLPKEAADDLASAKTKGAVQHSIPMRHSGDLFTGSGNCLAVGAALDSACLENFTFFCDGDDTLLFMDDESQLEQIINHLDKLGYTISYDKAIYLDNDDWEIEFCHVFYSKDGYYVDSERMLNRFCNIIGSSDDAIANTILGKLQAITILEATGIDFGIPVKRFVRLDETNERDRIVMNMYKGMERYRRDTIVKLDILGLEGGLAGRILADFVRYDVVLSRVGIRHWRKIALWIIKRHLAREHKDQDFKADSIRRLKQADIAISKLGLQAITPQLDDMYRELFARMYSKSTDDYDNFWNDDASKDAINQRMHRFAVKVIDYHDINRHRNH